MRWLPLLAFLGCTEAPPEDTGPDTRPWSAELPALAGEIGTVRGYTPMRAITHLHSPYSHDACDGDGWADGVLDEDCLGDLRAGLCATRFDVAFATDHPSHAAEQPFSDLLLSRGDAPIEVGGKVVGNAITCDDGHVVSYFTGIEDELMPIGLDHHAADTVAENSRLYNGSGEESLDAMTAAGGKVFVAHTEQRPLEHLQELQDVGLVGVEVFNLHAMFGPDIREEVFGLDPFGWLEDAMPFTDPDGTAEPDLLFLAVLMEQQITIEKWDALLQRGPVVGIAGTDAHENSIPIVMRDGERGDSYRRMMRWFSSVVLVEGGAPLDVEPSLAAGRSYVAFEVFGTPDGFDFHLDADRTYEMGEQAPVGSLVVDCPVLSESSPRGEQAPEIRGTVFRNGEVWQTGCGTYEVTEPGVYRARIDIVPHHLEPFLGDAPDVWMHAFPWIYGNAIRVP